MKKQQVRGITRYHNWLPKSLARSKIYIYTNNNGETGIFVYWPERLGRKHHCYNAICHMLVGFRKAGWQWMKLHVREYSMSIMDIFLN